MASLNTGEETLGGHDRKRIKTSRNGKRPAPSSGPFIAPAVLSAVSSVHKPATMPQSQDQQPCVHEASLKAVHSDVDAMRTLVTCQICHRLMYEPFVLSCGHTYCYSCLSQWLPSHDKKTCPDCRAVITQQPIPSYIVRELVLVFTSRSQLLPDGETSEEHDQAAREERATLEKDKANTDRKTGGLFKGCFNKRERTVLHAVRDTEDQVDRCPACHWEVEDGYCNQCGVPMGDQFSDIASDETDEDEELDHEIDPDDHDLEHMMFDMDPGRRPWEISHDIDPEVFAAAFGHGPLPRPRVRLPSRPVNISSGLSELDSEEEEDDDEDDADLEGFIDDEPVDESESEGSNGSSDVELEDDEGVIENGGWRRNRVPVILSDDEEVESEPAHSAISLDSDDEDDGPVAAVNPRRKPAGRTRSRPIAVDSDDEAEDEDDGGNFHELSDSDSDEPSDEDEDDDHTLHATIGQHHEGFSPIDSAETAYPLSSSGDSPTHYDIPYHTSSHNIAQAEWPSSGEESDGDDDDDDEDDEGVQYHHLSD